MPRSVWILARSLGGFIHDSARLQPDI
jgi:hypothetical protein